MKRSEEVHEGLRRRIQQDLDDRNLDMKELSNAAGLGETAVRDVLKRRASPRLSTVVAIADALGRSIGELTDGELGRAQVVRVIGCVSAGEHWEPYDDPLGDFELRLEGGEPVALEVNGDSMSPVYRPGDMLIGARRTSGLAERLIGQDCILQTDRGERYVKFLMRGGHRGRYNLRSYNPAYKDIENTVVRWAAPIAWVKRSLR